MDDGKLQCKSCGREIEDGTSFCPFCGVALGATTSPARSGSDPYVLLMTANVLRLRHQWTLAEAKCSELLKLEPENPAAYSLMGDILRDQERVQDAIEWYKLAVDRNPASETDRRKLEALIERRFAEPRESCLRRHAKSWLARRAKPAREERPTRPVCPWAVVTAGVFAVTLLAAFGALLASKQVSRSRRPPGGPEMAGYQRYEPISSVRSLEPEGMDGDIWALEQSVCEMMREKASRFDVNCEVVRAEIDPRLGVVEIEMTMPSYWAPESTRKSILRMASMLAPAAACAEPRFSVVRVRCLTRHGSDNLRLAMLGEGSAVEFRRFATSPPEDSLEKVFRSLWWSEALKPEASLSAETPRAGAARPPSEAR